VPRRDAELDGCVRSAPLLDTPVVSALRWRCRHDGPALRAERHHTCWVVSMLQVGACGVHSGNWETTIDPAVAVLHAPGAVYRTSHPFGCIDTGWSFAIREDVGREIVERAGLSAQWQRPSLAVSARPGCESLRQLIALGSTSDPLEAEELVLAIFESLLAARMQQPRARKPGTDCDHRRTVERARAFLATHLGESITLERTAREVGASPAHLSRLFKKQTGVSMGGYLKQLRLAAVIEAVTRPGASLAEIAFDAGFYSQSHLTTVFRQEIGITPGEMRRVGLPVA